MYCHGRRVSALARHLLACFKMDVREAAERCRGSHAPDLTWLANAMNTSMLYVVFSVPLRDLFPLFSSIWDICPRRWLSRLLGHVACVSLNRIGCRRGSSVGHWWISPSGWMPLRDTGQVMMIYTILAEKERVFALSSKDPGSIVTQPK